VCLGALPGAGWTLPIQHRCHLIKTDRRRDEGAGIDRATRVGGDCGVDARRCGQDAHRGNVFESEGACVDHAWLSGEADVNHPTGRFDEVKGQRRQVGGVGGVDDGVERQLWQIVFSPRGVPGGYAAVR